MAEDTEPTWTGLPGVRARLVSALHAVGLAPADLDRAVWALDGVLDEGGPGPDPELLGSLDDLVFRLDARGRFMQVNAASEPVLGYRPADLRGRALIGLVEPRSMDDLAVELGQVLRHDGTISVRIAAVHRSGGVVWLDVHLRGARAEGERVVFGLARDVSSEVAAEESHRQAIERLRLSQELARIVTWEWDPETDHRWWSPDAVTLFEVSPEELGTDTPGLLARVHPEDRERVATMVAQSAELRRPVMMAFRIVTPLGQVKEVIAPGGRFRLRPNGSEVLVGALQDVTDLQALKERQRRADAQVRDLSTRSSELLAFAQSPELYDVIAEGLLALLGGPGVAAVVEREADGQLAIRAICDTKDRSVHTRLAEAGALRIRAGEGVDRLLRAGPLLTFSVEELSVLAPELEVLRDVIAARGAVDVHLIGAVRDDEAIGLYLLAPVAGAPPLVEDVIVAFATQATTALGWLRARDALERSEERMRRLLDAIPDQIFRFSADGVWLDYRSAGGERPYVEPSSFIGYHLSEVLPQPLAGLLLDANARALATGRVQVVEYDLEGVEGHHRWEARISAGSDGDVVAVVRDISDRQRYLQSQEALEASQRQLLHAQRLEAVGRLAGGVAHDFNNLLTVIRSHAQFLTEALPLGDPRRDDVDQIALAAERATNLTAQLLAFSRRQVVDPVALDLREVVSGVEPMIRRLIGEHIDVSVELGEQPCPAYVDRGQIEQIAVNLAVNARDAMPDGGRLALRCERLRVLEGDPEGLAAGEYVVLVVADDGSGMEPDVLEHVFEPFFTTKPVDKGTGLGLAMVYGIAQQSGGGVRIDTAPGVGTTVRVLFPETDLTIEEELPLDPTEEIRMEGRRILVVEDDPQVRDVTRRALERGGYRVVAAEGPLEALALFAEDPAFDLVLSDVVMPVMGGPALVEALRRRSPGLAVLLTTGYDPDETVRAGDFPVVNKPVPPDLLRLRVGEVLSQHRQAGPERAGVVLVVDDEEVLRGLFARVLSRAGYKVAAVGSAAEARAAAADGGVRLAVVDVGLGDESGLDLLTALRRERPLPAIVMSGGVVDRAVEPGVRVLLKPFPPYELVRTVRELAGPP